MESAPYVLLLLTIAIAFAAVNSVSIRPYSWEPIQGTCNYEGFKCNGCKKLQMCIKIGTVYTGNEATCESLNPKAPYCDSETNTCAAEVTGCETSTTDPVKVDTVVCDKVGYRWHPYDCRKRIMCVEEGAKNEKVAYAYPCGASSAFDIKTNACKYQQTCVDFSPENLCKPTNRGKIVTYPGEPRYYGLCPTRVDDNAMIGECIVSHEFNVTSFECKPVCKREGRFKAMKPEGSFIECTLVGSKYNLELLKCPLNSLFDDEKGYCVKKAN